MTTARLPLVSDPVTIEQLKAFVMDLPEEDADGRPFEVWIMTDATLSNRCVSVWPLNRGDIVLEPAGLGRKQ